jgi:hypothetical protein
MRERLFELGPEFLLAWAGWLMHSLVHSAGHIISRMLHRCWNLFR